MANNINLVERPDHSAEKIVIADNDPSVIMAINVALQAWAVQSGRRIQVTEFTQGVEAIQYLQNNLETKLLILDLMINESSGMEIAKRLYAMGINIPIILLASQQIHNQNLIDIAERFAKQYPQIEFTLRSESAPIMKVNLSNSLNTLLPEPGIESKKKFANGLRELIGKWI